LIGLKTLCFTRASLPFNLMRKNGLTKKGRRSGFNS
jgi:hypothetical protein